MRPLELWGGIESTLNRVHDQYFDQLRFSGHDLRPEDIDRVAALGLRTVRYPILWERVSPTDGATYDWSWADDRLRRLRDVGIDPIVGLVHHGSGPRYTHLLDPEFPEKLAAYARRVAQRYPWICRYTPINEPLTTARFSGLYGHWYPHHARDQSFILCLLHQCLGISAAMREIRRVQPSAELVLTEDVGQTASSPTLAYQARFENHRRWLSMDLLAGRVTPEHRLWRYLTERGGSRARAALASLAGNPCMPDLIGINHYLTSNRYLDDDLALYPEWSHGGNGRHAYADVEAVRVSQAPSISRTDLCREIWSRYRLPIAITESHLHGPREEQVRWFLEAWRAAQALRLEGVDMRAVTVWSLFGTYDWVCLATRCDGIYEAGVYDVRSPTPRPTALASCIQTTAGGDSYEHPALAGEGWWRRPDRVLYPPQNPKERLSFKVPQRGVLITGARGTLGQAFARVCQRRGLAYMTTSRQEMDISVPENVHAVLDARQPWAVVNAAGYVRVDDAEKDQDRCSRENVQGAAVLARACADRGIPIVTFSSDLVFDGSLRRPYSEQDIPRPLSVYGASKWQAEERVRQEGGRSLIIRTSAIFGPWDAANFVTRTLRAVAAGEPVMAVDDVWVTPTYVPDLAHVVLDLLIDGETGLWHLAHPVPLTWFELARHAIEHFELDPSLLHPCSQESLRQPARRPIYSALTSERGVLLDPLERALQRYAEAIRPPVHSAVVV